jgi:tRNA A-37 threonylcarbamoyl transferase component Bud32
VPVCVAAFVTGAALAGARGDRGAVDAGAVIWFAGLIVTADRDQSSARPGDAVGPGTTSGGRPAAFDESALQASASAYLERVAPDDAADEDPAPRSAVALPAVRRSPLDTGRISERVQIGVLDTQREASSVADTTEVAVESLRFGHFKALHMIGEGAMSRVYVALDEELDRKVAVKLFHPTSDPADRFRGQREAQALARISHPNVVQIYESGSLGAHTFIVMEFVEGVTLTTWQAEHPRSLQELLRMYIAVGRGLVAAHSAGVVHRDFKPDNVLVDRDGRPRVADFGLASIRGAVEAPASGAAPARSVMVTSAGSLVGTPAYMSPEQYRSSRVDEFSDQFSFCTAFFEALYGERPYRGRTIHEIRAQVADGRIQEPPPERRVPPAVHGALIRGLAQHPGERWPSLAALLDHLERYDPDRDPTLARREQRSFTRLLDAMMLVVGGVMLTLSYSDPGALTAVALIVPVAVVLVISGAYMWILRHHLVAHRFHWLMLRILLLLVSACLVGRVLGALAGYAPSGVLLLGLLGVGTGAASISVLVAPVIFGMAVVQLACALLVALEIGPITVIDVVAQTATVMMYTRAWRASATADYFRVPAPSPCPDPAPSAIEASTHATVAASSGGRPAAP